MAETQSLQDKSQPHTDASKGGQYSHQGSPDDVGKAFDVNENDVRDKKRSDNEAEKKDRSPAAEKKT